VKRSTPIVIAAVLAACQTTPQLPTLPPTTSLKAYEKEVLGRMNAVWNRIAIQEKDRLSLGTIKLKFKVLPDGHVSDLVVLANSGNEVLSEVATRTVQETCIPAIPRAALKELPHHYMPGDCSFTVYPLR
jgi:outer membrane biosynthesis protein TonB